MNIDALMVEVEAAFARTAAGLERWDDPHPPPDRVVGDDEYSRVTNPEKWRIIGARADAWIEALVDLGLATVERDAAPKWVEGPATTVIRTDVVTPAVEGGIPLVVCRSRIEDVPDAGVTLGVGARTVRIGFVPDCGCDACDSGSQDVLDEVDSYIRPVVSGEFRFLWRGRESIMIREGGRESRNIGSGGAIDPTAASGFRFLPTSVAPTDWRAAPAPDMSGGPLPSAEPRRGRRTRDRVDEILADATGWDEARGPSWLSGPHGDVRH